MIDLAWAVVHGMIGGSITLLAYWLLFGEI